MKIRNIDCLVSLLSFIVSGLLLNNIQVLTYINNFFKYELKLGFFIG